MFNTSALACVCLALLTAISGHSASADTVRLATGEALTVEVLGQSKSEITFRHPILGTVTLPASAVIQVVIGDGLTNGSQNSASSASRSLPGSEPSLPSEEASAVVVEGESHGGLEEVATDIQSTSVDPSSQTSSHTNNRTRATDGTIDGPDAEPVNDGGWQFRFTLASAGSSGNTETASLTTRLAAIRETEHASTLIEGVYQFGSQDGDKSDNRGSAGVRNDWLFPGKRHFYFADARYDYDEFQSWLHRVSGHLGIGYRLFEGPPFVMSGRAGLGALKEWKSENEDLRPEALLGLEGVWDVSIDHAFRFSSTYFPDLGDATSFRWVNSAGWTWRIARGSSLSLSTGLEHEYQSKVDPDQDRNDIRVFAGVDFEF